jgi:methylmalonyl-CoA/ethylmalonyl-CoA epimerase
MKIEKIVHVHVLVKDLGQAVKHFSDIMGTKYIGPIKGISPIITAFDDVGLELQQPLPGSESYIADLLNEYGEGIHHIAIKVESVEEAVAELKSKGVTILKKGGNENFKFAVTDPKDFYGVGLELLEYQRVQEVSCVVTGKTAEVPWM